MSTIQTTGGNLAKIIIIKFNSKLRWHAHKFKCMNTVTCELSGATSQKVKFIHAFSYFNHAIHWTKFITQSERTILCLISWNSCTLFFMCSWLAPFWSHFWDFLSMILPKHVQFLCHPRDFIVLNIFLIFRFFVMQILVQVSSKSDRCSPSSAVLKPFLRLFWVWSSQNKCSNLMTSPRFYHLENIF